MTESYGINWLSIVFFSIFKPLIVTKLLKILSATNDIRMFVQTMTFESLCCFSFVTLAELYYHKSDIFVTSLLLKQFPQTLPRYEMKATIREVSRPALRFRPITTVFRKVSHLYDLFWCSKPSESRTFRGVQMSLWVKQFITKLDLCPGRYGCKLA